MRTIYTYRVALATLINTLFSEMQCDGRFVFEHNQSSKRVASLVHLITLAYILVNHKNTTVNGKQYQTFKTCILLIQARIKSSGMTGMTSQVGILFSILNLARDLFY